MTAATSQCLGHDVHRRLARLEKAIERGPMRMLPILFRVYCSACTHRPEAMFLY